MPNLLKAGMSIDGASATVFANDVRAIEACDVLLLNLDGRAIDEGAAFELGLAFARNKCCVGIQTDFRRLSNFGNNPMITNSLETIFSNEKELEEWAIVFLSATEIAHKTSRSC